MSHKAGLVAVVRVAGESARELKGDGARTVLLPFGSEYSLGFKNLESRRVAVSVTVDGKDALEGRRLVINPNEESELKGFLEGNVAKNSFKFIEMTDKIRDHRGSTIDDGMIRIEFQYEEPEPVYQPLPIAVPVPYPYPVYPKPYIWRDAGEDFKATKGIRRTRGVPEAPLGGQAMCFNACVPTSGDIGSVVGPQTAGNLSFDVENDQGITVAGSRVNQNFGTTYLRRLDPTKHVIVFELRGEKRDGRPIKQAVLSRRKVECETCGTKCESSAKFCPECSTCLV